MLLAVVFTEFVCLIPFIEWYFCIVLGWGQTWWKENTAGVATKFKQPRPDKTGRCRRKGELATHSYRVLARMNKQESREKMWHRNNMAN